MFGEFSSTPTISSSNIRHHFPCWVKFKKAKFSVLGKAAWSTLTIQLVVLLSLAMITPSTSSHYGSSFLGLPIHLFRVICSEPCSQMETPGSHHSGLPSAIYPWVHCWVLVLWSLLCKLPLTFPKQHLGSFFLNESTGLVKWHDPLFLTQFLRGLGNALFDLTIDPRGPFGVRFIQHQNVHSSGNGFQVRHVKVLLK